MEPLRQIGFVGLGKMGFPMAGRLAAAGFALKVYDIDPRVQEQFTAVHPAAGCESPADAGRHSDLVITMLPDGRAVRAVALGSGAEDGLAAGMASGSILVDMSSSSPLATRDLGKRLASRGIHMLDAPVSGGVSKARDGTLAIMAGGEPEALERCRPVFAAVGERIFFSGPLGSGHAVKALNNMLSAAGFIAAVEVLLVGRRFGVDPRIMNEILNASTGRNNTTENKMEKFVFSRSFSSGFSLDLMVKDLNTAMELARELEAPALFCTACRELWATAQSSLGKGLDHTDVVRWFEDLVHARLGD